MLSWGTTGIGEQESSRRGGRAHDGPGRLVELALKTFKGDLEPAILDVDLKENVREGEEVLGPESLRLKNDEKGIFAAFAGVLCGGEEGEHDALCRMNGMFANCRHPQAREPGV